MQWIDSDIYEAVKYAGELSRKMDYKFAIVTAAKIYGVNYHEVAKHLGKLGAEKRAENAKAKQSTLHNAEISNGNHSKIESWQFLV